LPPHTGRRHETEDSGGHMRASRVVPVLVVLCLWPGVWSGQLGAWGVEGHHLIARIALSQMTPDATRAVQDLLGTEDFVACSTWADEVRPQRPETYNWHFVDIPYDQYAYNAGRDCPSSARGDCIVAELDRTRQVLLDATRAKDQQKEALKFLIHFVGDLHQPLHAIDNHDRGGNDVHVLLVGHPPPATGSLNLHTVWDTTLISQRGLDEAAYAERLIQEVRAHPLPVGLIDFAQWAGDTHQIAVQYAYAYAGFSPTGPPANPVELGTEYQAQGQLAVDHQLELAGVRLAAILNGLFAKRTE